MFEGSVAGGVPVIRPMHRCLSANKIEKVCGILTESSFKTNGRTDWAVIGIGINLVKPKNGFPDEISNIANAIFEKE